jgi:hypothetical protein
LGFYRNRFLIDPLHYLLGRSDFGFELAEIFLIEKQLSDSANRGVSDSPTRRVRELFFSITNISAFECLKENSASRGVAMVSWEVDIQIFKNF